MSHSIGYLSNIVNDIFAHVNPLFLETGNLPLSDTAYQHLRALEAHLQMQYFAHFPFRIAMGFCLCQDISKKTSRLQVENREEDHLGKIFWRTEAKMQVVFQDICISPSSTPRTLVNHPLCASFSRGHWLLYSITCFALVC